MIDWPYIIKAAIAAPSADNSQPWLFEISENRLTLRIDPSRSGGTSDQSFFLSDFSIGTVICNIEEICSCLGYHCETSILPEATKNPFTAAICTITPSTANETDSSHIFSRHTDRSFPWSDKLSQEQRNELEQAVNSKNDSHLHWLDGKRRKSALKILCNAESLRFKTKELHNELFSSIRFDVNWKAAVDEGLAPASLGIEWFARPVFRLSRHWKIMKLFNIFGAHNAFAFRSTALPCLLSPELGLISINSSSRESVIRGGIAFQSLWLKATQMGYSLQPFAATGVLCLAEHLPIPNSSKTAVIDAIRELSNSPYGLIFFRLGKARQPFNPSSLRRKPAAFGVTQT